MKVSTPSACRSLKSSFHNLQQFPSIFINKDSGVGVSCHDDLESTCPSLKEKEPIISITLCDEPNQTMTSETFETSDVTDGSMSIGNFVKNREIFQHVSEGCANFPLAKTLSYCSSKIASFMGFQVCSIFDLPLDRANEEGEGFHEERQIQSGLESN